MKVAIIGSRNFTDKTRFSKEMERVNLKITEVVSGGASGADSLAEDWARSNGIQSRVYLPDWKKFGKSAGFVRNKDIINNSEACIAFWDGASKGTMHSINIAKEKGIPIIVIII